MLANFIDLYITANSDRKKKINLYPRPKPLTKKRGVSVNNFDKFWEKATWGSVSTFRKDK
jgi:hypothetical protein